MAKSKKPKAKVLIQKFEDTAFQLTQERNDFFLPQIVDFVKNKRWLDLQPEYQRRRVWDVKKQSLFIESLLLNIPVPPLFLYEHELSRYEVMDGQQRLTSIVGFYTGHLVLKGLQTWRELNGMRYSDLPTILQRGLDRRRISATVLLAPRRSAQGSKLGDIQTLVFTRLNTGGMRLTAQELRNCLYASPFNNLLIALAREKTFAKIWEIHPSRRTSDDDDSPDSEESGSRLFQRMGDCELVLRFFAFRDRDKIKGSVRSMLDKCMERHLTLSSAGCAPMGAEFSQRIALAHHIFGNETFRYHEKFAWRKSAPLYDAVMLSIDRLWAHRAHLLARKVQIRKALAGLLLRHDAFVLIVGRPNTAKAIAKRIDLVHKTIRRAARV